MLFQRRIVDFGADASFADVVKKVDEHYGVSVPESSIRCIVEGHARLMREHEDLESELPDRDGVACVIAEVDGTMIPIVTTDKTNIDGSRCSDDRKNRQVFWKEARLSFARKKGSATPHHGAVCGTCDEAGDHLLDSALKVGLGKTSVVHGVGDGAPWIADQVDRVFGSQASYLVDFYHLCEYLAAASKGCSSEPQSWLEEQKKRLKQNHVSTVLEALRPHIEPDSVPRADAPVRNCSRYITNRPNQFNYKQALDQSLPIGSGEVEGNHRSVIQKRLKIPGAWWKEENANNMLALRTLRANNQWDNYWIECKKRAA